MYVKYLLLEKDETIWMKTIIRNKKGKQKTSLCFIVICLMLNWFFNGIKLDWFIE